MGTYRQFQTSARHEQEGIELDLGEAGIFRIARAGGANKRYQKRLEALLKPYRRAIQTETMSNEKAQELLAQVYAETVILGWDNVTGPDDEPLEFNVENCTKLLIDLPDLFRTIRETAENAALYRETILEEDAGNSETSSSTS